MKFILDKVNNSVASFRVEDFSTSSRGQHPFNYLYQNMSHRPAGVEYEYEYRNGLSDGIVRLFNRETGRFPLGLVPRVYELLKASSYTGASFHFTPALRACFSNPENVTEDEITEFAKSLGMPDFIEIRDYQMAMVTRGINYKRRTFSACTGAGKSLVVYLLVRWFLEKHNFRVLILVPNMSLVEQIYNDFVDYGWYGIKAHVSRLHSQVPKMTKEEKAMLKELEIVPDDLLKSCVISTWQTMQYKIDSGILDKYDVVIVDEAHTAQADVLAKIIGACRNSEYRIGLSGTLCKNEDLNDQLEGNIIVGAIGKTDMIVRPIDLIRRGILTPCKIVSILVQYDESSRRAAKKMKFQTEIEATSLSGSTIGALKMLINANRIKESHNTVVLVKNLKLLNSIVEMINEEYPQFKTLDYHGKISAKRREEIRKLLSMDNGYIVVASYPTFQAGINVPKLDNLVLGQGSASPIRVRQSIGRILRRHKDKKVAYVYDIVDDLRHRGPRAKGVRLNHSYKHYERRKGFYLDDEYEVTEVKSDFECSFENMDVGKGFDDLVM